LCLAGLVVLQVLSFFGWPQISASAILFWGAVVLQFGPDLLPKAQGNHTGGLPRCPMLEYVVNILLAKVVVLFEGHLLRQVLWFNIVTSGPS